MTAIPEFRAITEKIIDVAKETKVFRFVVQEDEQHRFRFQAGQFVSLKIQEKVFRAYSISCAASEAPAFETCVKIIPDGIGSMYLDNLMPGNEIIFRGPFGQFIIKNPDQDKLFIATGTGISPIKAFVDEFAAGNSKGKHELVFGVRTHEYAAYFDELTNLAQINKDFKFSLCISQPLENSKFAVSADRQEIQNSKLYQGRVTGWAQEKDPEYFTSKDIYMCGSPAMVKEMTQILTEQKNVAKENIHTEAY